MNLLIANFSWDQVLYYLIPLIWVLQYFLPGKKKDEEEQPSAPEQREAAEAAQERMRKIREEIRQRVESQREGGSTPGHPPVMTQPQQERPAVSTLRPQFEEQEVAVEPAAMTFDQPNPQDELQERLREQQARLKEARKAREAALRQTKETLKQAKSSSVSNPVRGDLRSEVFATLQSPVAARKAIILSEILGEPRSLKPYS